jgi:hypothetical protein
MSSKKAQDVGRVQRQNSGSSARDPQEYLPSYEMAMGDPPPALVAAGPGAHASTPDTGEEPTPKTSKMSTTDRWIWAGLVVLPLFAAMVLTFLSAASADTWRAELCVLRISLPEDVWTPLQTAGTAQAAANDSPTNISLGTIFRRDPPRLNSFSRRDGAAGYLSLAAWGWCLEDADTGA